MNRVRDGIIANGGTPLEFPCHPIQESTRRPTASLDRNLAYLSLTEVLHGYPLDGVVLLTGCDKTYVLACVCGLKAPSVFYELTVQHACAAHGGRNYQHSRYSDERWTDAEWQALLR